MLSVFILLFIILVVVAILVLSDRGDWPDHDDLEPPNGGAGGII